MPGASQAGAWRTKRSLLTTNYAPKSPSRRVSGRSNEKLAIVRGAHNKNERWLKKHPNVRFHFTPTRSSWLNQVETWFSILQGQSLTGASFTAVEQLQKHIDAFITAYNETAEPFAWTKKKVHQRRFKNRRITQL